jgi:fusion and transport protein UGO1
MNDHAHVSTIVMNPTDTPNVRGSNIPSLRVHHDPSSTWSFSSPQALAPPQAQVASSPPTHSYQWTPSRNNNSIFDLSPSLADGSEPLNATLVFRSLVASAVLQYTSTAIAMPWEVGKLLLQVQWIPRHDSEQSVPESSREEEEEEEEVMSESSNDDSYFADPAAASAPRKYPAARLTDEQGYVIRRHLSDEGTRPAYIIPIGSADGVWGMIRRVRRFPGEGWLSLWKGLLTSSVTELAFTTMQPVLQACLHSVFMPSGLQPNSIFLPVASHLLAGFILSPLDLIRTRLIAQAFSSRHRTYSGPFDALVKITREEGGFKGLYLHPHLFIPTVIDCTLKPLIALSLPGLLGSYLGVHEDTSHPLVWGLAEMVGGCVGLLVTLPFETARRRLQIQTRGTAKKIKTCVETRSTPYNGVADCLWQVVAEERSD